jgi:hypothetical protein
MAGILSMPLLGGSVTFPDCLCQSLPRIKPATFDQYGAHPSDARSALFAPLSDAPPFSTAGRIIAL